ncbi:hypothetical protein BDU57DRAFT_455785 [Ampelomyces quisqualis]|uniref:N-acetylgalactosaminide beta-1,3-galactosyltransferase n=1 Tax=Ampelomyces quisqualis TaxID=50730 RepID=A0A6A5QFF2_AMPQU|nr:hypothetical protein BDU57DRAFT_455785 [Ampelomyces quisqualis]
MMVRPTPLRLLCAALVLAALLLTTHLRALFGGGRRYDLAGPAPPGPACAATIVLTLGAGQVHTQLPRYLRRLGRCKHDVLLFSDRQDSYHGLAIADALAHVRPEYRFNNADFDVYDRIQNANASAATTRDGRRLDKYKALPMMEWTAYLRPDAPWFVFVELDTYVNYDNLFRFLARFNPASAHYFGAPVWPTNTPAFAHGGSGYVLSRGALQKIMALGRMFGENKHFPGTHFFGQDVQNTCCGDQVLAQVLKKSGVPLRGYWPMFNREPPSGVRFNREQWCEAVITLHPLQDDDFAALGAWEDARAHPERPLMFEELYTLAEPTIQEKLDDWTNLSQDKTYKQGSTPAKSFDKCHRACLQDAKCMQFEYTGLECHLEHSIRLGHHKAPDGERKSMSGWITSRIESFKKKHSPCQGAHFVHSNP